ncbi:uncharacterized protein P174DRAFT_436660 [Aspergillus novofumigatus IBT 16806]|uniref:Uncharacterized protein n=1 Tax=Aspergillus novofumigatus (strain IBT 16806) TaxID=1392255 RepID=A0A2I1CKW8_ASPN1|nr:uncharacterized protein P174DRAFT_436660 [Aspergillus novofumigatus IBT 16806]PKX98269.1 hypothetical protein P174DRAFT_436660 [Aspergillus novofumigatus IBT 16806]
MSFPFIPLSGKVLQKSGSMKHFQEVALGDKGSHGLHPVSWLRLLHFSFAFGNLLVCPVWSLFWTATLQGCNKY